MLKAAALAVVPSAAPGWDRGEPHVGDCVEHSRRYRLIGRIGEGGMGTVWRAHDEVFNRHVAIKFLKPDLPEGYQQRFRREAQIGAELSHPNLVRVVDAGSRFGGDIDWMAMDCLEGNDLGDVIDAQGRLGVPVLLDVFAQALQGLAQVHQAHIVHRDIKPYNLFLARRRGRLGFDVKVIDFGISRNLDACRWAEEEPVGDPRYMAPEQAVMGAALDGRTDLYALGISLYQAATGRHPWSHLFDAPVPELLRAHREQCMAPPSSRLPGGVPPAFARGLDELVDMACAVDPAHRFGGAEAMAEALARLAHDAPRA